MASSQSQHSEDSARDNATSDNNSHKTCTNIVLENRQSEQRRTQDLQSNQNHFGFYDSLARRADSPATLPSNNGRYIALLRDTRHILIVIILFLPFSILK